MKIKEVNSVFLNDEEYKSLDGYIVGNSEERLRYQFYFNAVRTFESLRNIKIIQESSYRFMGFKESKPIFMNPRAKRVLRSDMDSYFFLDEKYEYYEKEGKQYAIPLTIQFGDVKTTSGNFGVEYVDLKELKELGLTRLKIPRTSFGDPFRVLERKQLRSRRKG